MSKLKEYKLDELYKMSSGISSTPEQAGHGTPFLSFSTIFNNYFIPDELEDKMNTSESEQKTYSIKKGDVFLTRTSENLDELAMSCCALKDYPKATFSGFAKRLRPIQDNITYYKFMGFFFRSNYFRKIIDNNAIMTLRASFNENIFSYIKIFLPDYKAQKKAGDFLYLIEKKIELNNQINKEIESLAKTLYEYWFVQFDFPDKQGMPYKSSGGEVAYSPEIKRELPATWEVKKLGEVCDLYQSQTISDKEMIQNGNFWVYGANGIIGKYDKFNHKDSEIIISCRGSCGNIIRTLPESWITGNSMVVKIKNNAFHNEFIYQSLRYMNLNQAISGSVQKQITRTNLETINVIVPQEDIIQKYEQIIKPNIKLWIANKEENQTLLELRNWLLPMLINCQVQFKGESQINNELSSEKLIKQAI